MMCYSYDFDLVGTDAVHRTEEKLVKQAAPSCRPRGIQHIGHHPCASPRPQTLAPPASAKCYESCGAPSRLYLELRVLILFGGLCSSSSAQAFMIRRRFVGNTTERLCCPRPSGQYLLWSRHSRPVARRRQVQRGSGTVSATRSVMAFYNSTARQRAQHRRKACPSEVAPRSRRVKLL